MTRAGVFLDRDGTLIDELGFLASPDGLCLLPGAAEGVRLLNQAGLAVVVVTNQSGIARGLFGEAELAAIHGRLRDELARSDARLDAILHCPHHPDFGAPGERACTCRKPEPGLFLEAALRLDLDLPSSFSVGDSARDLEAGRRAGLAGLILVATGKGAAEGRALTEPLRSRVQRAPDLPAAARLILAQRARARQGR